MKQIDSKCLKNYSPAKKTKSTRITKIIEIKARIKPSKTLLLLISINLRSGTLKKINTSINKTNVNDIEIAQKNEHKAKHLCYIECYT